MFSFEHLSFSVEFFTDESNQEVQRPVDTEHVNLVLETFLSFTLLNQLLAVSEKLLPIDLTFGRFIVKSYDVIFFSSRELLLLPNDGFQIGLAWKFVFEELVVLLNHYFEIFIHARESLVIRNFHHIF